MATNLSSACKNYCKIIHLLDPLKYFLPFFHHEVFQLNVFTCIFSRNLYLYKILFNLLIHETMTLEPLAIVSSPGGFEKWVKFMEQRVSCLKNITARLFWSKQVLNIIFCENKKKANIITVVFSCRISFKNDDKLVSFCLSYIISSCYPRKKDRIFFQPAILMPTFLQFVLSSSYHLRSSYKYSSIAFCHADKIIYFFLVQRTEILFISFYGSNDHKRDFLRISNCAQIMEIC